VTTQLGANQETQKDAFNQFMMQLDDKPEEQKSENQLDLVQSVLMSCIGLLTAVEIKDRVSLTDCSN
jgi:hypothetical protein